MKKYRILIDSTFARFLPCGNTVYRGNQGIVYLNYNELITLCRSAVKANEVNPVSYGAGPNDPWNPDIPMEPITSPDYKYDLVHIYEILDDGTSKPLDIKAWANAKYDETLANALEQANEDTDYHRLLGTTTQMPPRYNQNVQSIKLPNGKYVVNPAPGTTVPPETIVDVKTVTPSQTAVTGTVGQTANLTVAVAPEGAQKGIQVGIDDPTICAVTYQAPNYVISYLQPGITNVRFISESNPAISGVVKVTINPVLPTELTADPVAVLGKVGDIVPVTITTTPYNADQSLDVVSDQPSIALVTYSAADHNYHVQCVSAGNANLTFTSKSAKNVTLKVAVTVADPNTIDDPRASEPNVYAKKPEASAPKK